jgi:hypothetical protein
MTTRDSTAAPPQTGAARRQLSRVTGVAGPATMLLVFVPAVAGSGQEPAFDATPAEIVTFFRSVSSPLADFGSFVATVGLIAFLWFAVGLASLLRVAEGEFPWRSSVAAFSGAVLVALVLAGNWDAAAFRADDLDPQVARYAFDEGNVSFANGWVALGSFAVCSGWVIAVTGFLPRWLGWWAIVSGVGLTLSRVAWTNEIWLLPYGLFWLWVVIVSVLLLRRDARRVPERGRGSMPE